MVKTFTSFHPLGVVLVALLGVNVYFSLQPLTQMLDFGFNLHAFGFQLDSFTVHKIIAIHPIYTP